eukprot:6475408-Amphidinium_carterae.2
MLQAVQSKTCPWGLSRANPSKTGPKCGIRGQSIMKHSFAACVFDLPFSSSACRLMTVSGADGKRAGTTAELGSR